MNTRKNGKKNQPVERIIPIQLEFDVESSEDSKDNRPTSKSTVVVADSTSQSSRNSESNFDFENNHSEREQDHFKSVEMDVDDGDESTENKQEGREAEEKPVEKGSKHEENARPNQTKPNQTKPTEKASEKPGKDNKQKEEEAAAALGPKFRPAFKVPEKIIIVFDRAQDEDSTDFECDGKKFSPSHMLKYVLKFFLYNKSALNQLNEFAVMELNESTATWVHDFTRNVPDLLRALDKISDCTAEDRFDLTPVFEVVNKQIPLCVPHGDPLVPPLYIVRMVLLYGRSYTIPYLNESPQVKQMMESPYFTFDVCMTHEPISASNHAARIFEILQNIDKKGLTYAYSVHRNSKQLHEAMAKLLAHPLQRPHQQAANYSINLKY